MAKKLLVVFGLVALVSGGAFAQLTLGVTGALHMDTQLGASEIANDFKTGDNIYYGGFVEIIGKHLGLGASVNVSPSVSSSVVAVDLINYDANLYLSYHFFGGRAFLDPFAEFGVGVFALDYKNSSDRPTDVLGNPAGTSPIAASPYWFGALGLGVNLGPIGVFGKFAFNGVIQRQLTDNSTKETIPYYGTYSEVTPGNWIVTEYIPQYRVTLGVKLIL